MGAAYTTELAESVNQGVRSLPLWLLPPVSFPEFLYGAHIFPVLLILSVFSVFRNSLVIARLIAFSKVDIEWHYTHDTFIFQYIILIGMENTLCIYHNIKHLFIR